MRGEERIFLIPLSIAFLNPKILGFLFLRNLGGKMPKIKLHKIVGNLLDKLRKLYMHEWNGHLEILSFPQGIENCRQFVLLRTDILQETVVGCP